MKIVLGILLCIPFLIWSGLKTYNSEIYEIRCGEHIDRAAHANTVELAKSEITQATKYLEDNRMTQGYTSVLYTSPLEDVGYWYGNLKAGQKELENLPSTSSALEQTNVLMRIRESLSKTPDGISVFPANVAYCWLGWLFGLLLCGGMIVVCWGLCDSGYL